MSKKIIKSCNIVFDKDGKISSFDSNCENLFKYNCSEAISDKRIFNLFHSDYIMHFINKFNNLINDNKLVIREEVLCLRKDGTKFIANIVLKKINFFYSLSVEENITSDYTLKSISSFFDKLHIIIRSKYLLGSIIPLLFSIVWSLKKYDNFSFSMLLILTIGVLFFHISANTFNDYFDWVSGRDKLNKDYILFSTGGSRAIDFKFISEKNLLIISIISFFIVLMSGIFIIYTRGIEILYLGVFGALSVYFYSAPPLHLASRYGIGELLHILCLGPLFIYGCVLSLTGCASFLEFYIGLPFGILITACLLINEYPDFKSDKISKKINLSVLVGVKYIPYLFIFLIFSAFLSVIILILNNYLSIIFLSIFLTLPYAISSIKSVFLIGNGREFMLESCSKSFKIYLFFSMFLIFSIIIEYIVYG